VRVVDTNVLLYAVNPRVPDHAVARAWLDDALSGSATVGFAWVALLGFVRISTRAGIFDRPLTSEEAMLVVEQWLGSPAAQIVQPTPRHSTVLAGLLREAGAAGNLTTDAHLAALAIEHRATVASFDGDFDRLPGVRWERPTAPEAS
jgi:hypothetical protein